MSDKKINLEEILMSIALNAASEEGKHSSFSTDELYIIFLAMKEACRQTLELAAKNADVTINSIEDLKLIVNEQSILDTIKQIE